MQPGLFPIKPAPGTGRQLHLPIDVTRVARPAEPPAERTPPPGEVRGQQMLPDMPRRPRIRRPQQLPLWTEPEPPAPKNGDET